MVTKKRRKVGRVPAEECRLADDSDQQCDVADMLDLDEDLDTQTILNLTGMKRKRPVKSDEKIYEKQPRKHSQLMTNQRLLLPVKDSHGLVFLQTEEEKDSSLGLDQPLASEHELKTASQTMSLAERLAERHKFKREAKAKIGMYCSSIVENPENNVGLLKELLDLMGGDPTRNMVVTNLTILSLLEVFGDIIPSYRIRPLSQREKSQKMKKDTRRLNRSEESLLRYYKRYLDFLFKSVHSKAGSLGIYAERKKKLRVTAAHCLSKLLLAHMDFNFGADIAKALVPPMAGPDPEVAKICCEAAQEVFKRDKSGQTTLVLVQCMVKVIRTGGGKFYPNLLRTFLSLHLEEANVKDSSRPDVAKARERRAKMSRKERKREKKARELDRELKETEVQENIGERARIDAEILKRVFHIYFRVLKTSTRSELLTPVLEGLSKFAHLINVEFFDDLLEQLYQLPNRVPLTDGEAFHCLLTVFSILSGRGSVLNVDPQRFLSRLYVLLLNVHAGCGDHHRKTLQQCLEVAVIKKRKTECPRRSPAWFKRLFTVGLQCSSQGTMALLSAAERLLATSDECHQLLETEDGCGGGVFLPEAEDPEHCNAQATALWELPYLFSHYHPEVYQRARLLAGLRT